MNDTAARSVVFGGRQAHRPFVRQRNNRLDRTLSESFRTEKNRAVVILKAPGKDFRGACGISVDQQDQRDIQIFLRINGMKFLFRTRGLPFRVNHKLAFFQEPAAYFDCRIQKSSRIVPQVDDDSPDLLFRKLFQRLVKIGGSRIGEIRNPEVAELSVNDSDAAERWNLNEFTGQCKLLISIGFPAVNLDRHFGSRCAFQH